MFCVESWRRREAIETPRQIGLLVENAGAFLELEGTPTLLSIFLEIP